VSGRSRGLIIPTGKRKGHNPSLASIYRALAEQDKTEAYPEAIEQAHADFAARHIRWILRQGYGDPLMGSVVRPRC